MKWLLAILVIWVAWKYLRPSGKRRVAGDREMRELAAASAVLGVAPGADAGEIRAAHRRLMADVHPDRGGSDEDTRRVNAARDLLLSHQRG